MIVSSVIGGLATVLGAVLGSAILRKLTKIHVLVNSRLDQALSEIDDLKTQRDLKAEEPGALP